MNINGAALRRPVARREIEFAFAPLNLRASWRALAGALLTVKLAIKHVEELNRQTQVDPANGWSGLISKPVLNGIERPVG
jgi:hypothetical protein